MGNAPSNILTTATGSFDAITNGETPPFFDNFLSQPPSTNTSTNGNNSTPSNPITNLIGGNPLSSIFGNNPIGSITGSITSTGRDLLSNVTDELGDVTDDITGQFTNQINNLQNNTTSMFNTGLSNVQNTITNQVSSLQNSINNAAMTQQSAFNSAISNQSSMLQSTITNAQTNFLIANAQLASQGSQILAQGATSIVQQSGILDAVQMVGNEIGDVVDTIDNNFARIDALANRTIDLTALGMNNINSTVNNGINTLGFTVNNGFNNTNQLISGLGQNTARLFQDVFDELEDTKDDLARSTNNIGAGLTNLTNNAMIIAVVLGGGLVFYQLNQNKQAR